MIMDSTKKMFPFKVFMIGLSAVMPVLIYITGIVFLSGIGALKSDRNDPIVQQLIWGVVIADILYLVALLVGWKIYFDKRNKVIRRVQAK